MATHDYVISNASGAAVRADLNNALAAIVSNNSNATEPSTTYAYQWWADTGSSPAVMKLRNAANDAWIELFQLDGEWSTIALEDGTAAAPSLYFKDSGTDTGFFSSGTDEVAITTGGSERMRIDSSGRVLVNTSNAIHPNFVLQVVGNSGVQAGQILMRHFDTASGDFWHIGPDTSSNNFVVYNQDAVGVYIQDGSTGWTSSSDERLKTDLVNIEDGLAKVASLRAVTGRFKTDPEGKSRSFLIAQDVLSVFPEPVNTQNPDRLGLTYTEMIPLLVAALKESKERIETLEARVAALEGA